MYRHFLRPFNSNVTLKRFYAKENIRVRFAPSPTGYLHLGGLRTALYNYLFARSHNGTFILRIEDTDQTRVIPGSVEKLQDDLLWAGIISDEDPVRGGPAGFYLQSKRIDLYQNQVQVLLSNGSAYRCFCTEHRLNLLKKEAIQTRQIPKYDNRCKHLSKEQVQENLRLRKPYCIRFKLTPTPEPFKDLIYGDIEYDVTKNEGDPIIIKTDGFPTYHFANVVDDHFMEISHVLRGVEWQISTPKHLLIYKAFGWNPPKFGHLPLILNSDGSKLSKRQDDIKVEYYRREGIFPLALVNYITSAGGGFVREQKDRKCYSYQELIKQFDIGKINISSSKLNPEFLMEYNKLELKNLLVNEKNHKFLVERVIQIVKQHFPDRASNGTLKLDYTHIITTLKWAQTRISKINDLVSKDLEFLWLKPTTQNNDYNSKYLKSVKLLCKNLENIDKNNFCKDSLKDLLKEFTLANNIPFPEFMKMLRSVLSGLKNGPGVAEMMEILGKEATLDRLKQNVDTDSKSHCLKQSLGHNN